MKDLYKHDPDGVLAVVSSLREKASGYNDIITNLENCVNSINDSSSWIDVEVKTLFVNDCKNYISIYKDLIVTIGVYIDYLEKKSNAGVAIETTYSAG